MAKTKLIVYLFCVATLFSGCSEFSYDSSGNLSDIIFINEVSANHPTETDWVEIYNSSSSTVDLSGLFLSDDSANLPKWSFPEDTYINPKSYLVIECDGIGGGIKASFKISAGSEGVYLSNISTEKIDSISVVPPTNTGSFARLTDASPTWNIITTPTKGASN